MADLPDQISDDALRTIATRIVGLAAELAEIDASHQADKERDVDPGTIERQGSAAAIAATYNALRDLSIQSDALLRAYLAFEMIEEGKTNLAMLHPDRARQRPKTTERIEGFKARIAAIAFARGGSDKQNSKNAADLSELLGGTSLAYAITGRPNIAPRTILDWVNLFAEGRPDATPAVTIFQQYVAEVERIESKDRHPLPQKRLRGMLMKMAAPTPSPRSKVPAA